jgi:hypothetical protein
VPNDEDTLAHPEQPRFLLSAWLWAVALFVFFGAIVAIAFGTMSRGSTFEADRAKNRTEKLKTAQEEWAKNQGYGWVDKAKGVARIPIERAMEIELAELQAKKPAPAGPIATPAPAEVPVTATGAPPPANPPATGAGSPSPSPGLKAVEGPDSEIHGQPAAAANPPNASAGTQPGASATPAAQPGSHSVLPAVSPTAGPTERTVGTPIPLRVPAGSPTPPAAQPTASPKPQ